MRAVAGFVLLLAASLPAAAGGRTLAAMDVVSIRIPTAPNLDVSARIASDGTLALPYVGRLKAAGLTEDALARLVERRLVEKGVLADR